MPGVEEEESESAGEAEEEDEIPNAEVAPKAKAKAVVAPKAKGKAKMRWIPLREKGAKRSPKGAPAKKKPAPKKKPALKKISSPDVTPKAKAGKRKNAMPDGEEQEDQTKKPKEEPQPKEACNSDPKPSKKGDKTYNKTAKQEERRKLWMQFHRTKKPPKPGDRSQKCPPDALDQMLGDKSQTAKYFDLWIGHAKDWGKVTLFEQKMHRSKDGEHAETSWYTLDQLKAYFHNDTVANAVAASRTSEEVRANPLALDCAEARQYRVTLTKHVKLEEKEHLTGMSFQGEIGNEGDKDKEVLKMLGDHYNSSTFSSSTCKDPALEAKEKEERRKALEAKKEEKKRKLEHDFSARAEEWLRGINKDLAKLGQAINSALQAVDKEVRKQWKEKFQVWMTEITDFRKSFEKAIRNNQEICPKQMATAEANVAGMRRDIKAWTKIKDLYLPAKQDSAEEQE